MKQPKTPISEFFQRFENDSNCPDGAASAAHFADVFLAAGPNGAQAVKASDFALALPKRRQHFASHGLQSTALESVRETALGDRYVLAETRWKMTFAGGGVDEQVLAESVFVVDTQQDAFRIVFYLSKHDPIALLNARRIADRSELREGPRSVGDAHQLGTTDDCGFSPFADDVSTARETAFAKIRARVEGTQLAARELGV